MAQVREINEKSSMEHLYKGPARFPRIAEILSIRQVLALFLLGEVGKALDMAVPRVTPAHTAAVEERSTLFVGTVFETDPARRGLWNNQVIGGAGILGARDGFAH